MKRKSKKKYTLTMTKRIQILIGAAAILVLTLCIMGGMYVYAKTSYENVWYPNTIISGVDVSGCTLEESEEILEEFYGDYELDVTGRDDGYLQIVKTDGDIQIEVNQEALEESFLNQHESVFSAYSGDKEIEAVFDASYVEKTLKKFLKKSELVAGSDTYQIQEPVDAYIEYEEDTKSMQKVKEVLGNSIQLSELLTVVEEAIENGETAIDLTDEKLYPNVYKAPSVYYEDEALTTALEAYNKKILRWITWDMGDGQTETLTPADLYAMSSYDYEKEKVKINSDKLSDWVEAFCLKYKTSGATRSFVNHNGKTITVSGGDYGYKMDYDGTLKQAKEAIGEKTDSDALEAYLEDPTTKNQTKLTFTYEPDYTTKGAQTDFVNFSNDWDTQNYSEIDLTEQMVYVYRNGSLVYSCKCVSGLASDPERATKTGTYYVKEKKEEKTLVGEDYETDTKFWIRITWSGTGYHYMNRRDWDSWTPDLYKTRGSHGCLNLQYEDAKSLYDLIRIGDPVFIYNE